jgi:hypothetical protein
VSIWVVDGTLAQTGGTSFTLSNVVANHFVEVKFAALPSHKVTPIAVGTNGTISPSIPQTVNYGGSLTMTASPNAGYAVSMWVVDGILAQTGGISFTLSNVVANHFVEVKFVASP